MSIFLPLTIFLAIVFGYVPLWKKVFETSDDEENDEDDIQLDQIKVQFEGGGYTVKEEDLVQMTRRIIMVLYNQLINIKEANS